MNKMTISEQIDGFLELFDNDPNAAIQAIHNYTRSENINGEQTDGSVPPKSTRQVSDKTVISIRDLSKEYKVGRQKIVVLNHVSFDIYRGEFVAITAPSGSGKSTLLQLIGGLEKPTSGSVKVDDTNLNTMNDRTLSRFRGQTIGFVFQFFYLQPFLNLEKNLEVPGMFAHTKHKELRAQVQKLAETVGIADRLKHFPKELSGGQIQRAAIVRALINNPKVILADEPTGNLDSKNSTGIVDLFERIRQEFETTIVVATHDYAIAARADRTISLDDGVIVE